MVRLRRRGKGVPLSLHVGEVLRPRVCPLAAVWVAFFAALSASMEAGELGREVAARIQGESAFDPESVPTAYRYALFDADGVFFQTVELWATDEEYDELLAGIARVLEPYARNGSSEGRRRRTLSLVSAPSEDADGKWKGTTDEVPRVRRPGRARRDARPRRRERMVELPAPGARPREKVQGDPADARRARRGVPLDGGRDREDPRVHRRALQGRVASATLWT